MQEKSTIGRNSGRNAVIEVESKAHLVLVVQMMRIEKNGLVTIEGTEQVTASDILH